MLYDAYVGIEKYVLSTFEIKKCSVKKKKSIINKQAGHYVVAFIYLIQAKYEHYINKKHTKI